MTEDELKGLTMGDKVYVRAVVSYVDKDGMECRVQIYGADGDDLGGYMKAGDVYRALPGKAEGAVKDVACRLFRKGDKVRVVERNGRSPILCGAVELGGTYTVHADEDNGDVTLDIGYGALGGESIAWTFLELVTPVEELGPFTVVHKPALQHFQINHGKLNYMTFPYGLHKSNGWYHTITTAKAAAEAERDRLNAEYRKEAGNE